MAGRCGCAPGCAATASRTVARVARVGSSAGRGGGGLRVAGGRTNHLARSGGTGLRRLHARRRLGYLAAAGRRFVFQGAHPRRSRSGRWRRWRGNGRRARRKRPNAKAWSEFLNRARAGRCAAEDAAFLHEIEEVAWGQREQSRVLQALDCGQNPESAHGLLLRLGYWDGTVNPIPDGSGRRWRWRRRICPNCRTNRAWI